MPLDNGMVFDVMAMLVTGLAISFVSGAESARCPSRTVAVNVTSPADVQNLTDVLACTGGGTFNITWYFHLAIEQKIEVSDGKNVTVTGAVFPSVRGALGDDNGSGVIIETGRSTGIFSVSNGSTLRLNNLVLEGGDAANGGAVELRSSSSLFAVGCTFLENNASNGGAIYSSTSAIYLDGNTSFNDNSARFGGAIFGDESDIHIDGSTSFSHNSAEGSMTGAEIVSASVSSLYVYYTVLSPGNFSGGAIYADASKVYIDGNTSFTHNSADYQGGAIYGEYSAIQIGGNTYFSNNSAEGASTTTYFDWLSSFSSYSSGRSTEATAFGGAMYVQSSIVSLHGDTEFDSNYATQNGGAVYANSSKVYIGGNTGFSNNSASSQGGAVWVNSSNVFLDGNTDFFGNYGMKMGGALYATFGSEVVIDGSASFTSNSAGEDGGAMLFWIAEGSMRGTTLLVGNSAGQWGGAIRCHEAAIDIDGSAIFARNSAGTDGGAIQGLVSNFRFIGSKTNKGDLSGHEGALYSEAGDERTSNWSIAFVNNSAGGLGGAMFVEEAGILQVSDAMFKSNEAALGGAVYVAAVEDKNTSFTACVFEGNEAADGGAAYLYTGPGVDIFTLSAFRNNVASISGGAIFHTGDMRLLNTSFVANKAGVEGAAVMSIGHLEKLSDVTFSGNTYFCGAGQYGYIVKKEVDFCMSCFDEICSRCSTAGDGVTKFEDVRTGGFPVCAEPPPGATAPSSGTTVATLTLEKGYFRTSNQSHDVLKCYQASACQGGNDTDKYCTSGYTGPYCAVCAEGFTPGIAYSCRECSAGITRSAVGLAVAMGLAVLLLTTLVISHLGSVVHGGPDEDVYIAESLWKQKCWSCRASLVKTLSLTAIKIVVTVWQIISQFDAIAGHVYPELYKAFVSKLNPINLDLDFVLFYSCLVTNDFYDILLFATITPLLVLVILAGSYSIGMKRNSGSESAMREVRHKHQAAVLYFAFFVYSPVSYRVFQTFSCDELDDGEAYLRADYSISCLASRHSWYKAYALIMVGLYPIGIATAFASLLLWNRRDLVKPDREAIVHLKPVNGVWAAYKPSRYYYEVIECGRRIGLTSIAAFVLPNSTAQISIALLFAVVFVFISEALSPFQRGIDMGLYRWGNGIVVASMYVAFLMKIDVAEDKTSYMLTFSGVLILANVFMVVAVLVQTGLLVKEMRGMQNAVRVVDAPVRRTHSSSVIDVRPLNEGGTRGEGGVAHECKHSEI